jgi:serine/threonine-protein kinase
MDPSRSKEGAPLEDRDLFLKDWDRYQVLQLLGHGGMGRVYKAFDPRLKRHVALKFLIGDDPDVRSRFLQEPQAQARIDHPNVCKIYETGEVDGRPFIAMQFIDGQTLDRLSESLSLEQKLSIVREVAEGIHAAHRLGIIHRDLKPSNILVEKSESENGLHPYVMDFGLAREVSAPGLTATGTILGTPWYMPPEQVLGNVHSMDRRSDVYGLGATLYHLVCLRPPFDGSPLEILSSILREDPVPPHRVNPAVSEELETIIMKCLEKDPSLRYDSAHALSEDLSRYLEGEAIQARPPSFTYRMSKKARKNRLAVSIGAVAALLTLLLTGMWLRARWAAAEQAALSQQIGQRVEKLEGILRNIHMLPLHDTTNEKAMVQKQLQELEHQIEEHMSTLGTGPGNYSLGRVLFAQQDYRRATEHLQEAWDTGYRTPEVAYALGRSLGALYQEALEETRGTSGKQLRKKQERAAEQKFREPALKYLQASSGLKVDSPEYVEAFISLYAKKYDLARQKAQIAFRKVPWLYEAKILEGDALMAQVYVAVDHGNYKAGVDQSFLATEAYQAAARIGQSDPDAYKGLCLAWNNILTVRVFSTGEEVEPTAQQVRLFCEQAALADSSRSDIQSAMAQGYRVWGDYLLEHGQDPRPTLNLALSAAERAIKLAPEEALGFVYAGLVCWEMGKYEVDRGGNPDPILQKSIVYLKRALDLEPDNGPALNSLGLTYLDKGNIEMYRGGNPLQTLNQSASCFLRLAKIEPQYFSATVNLGIVYGSVGEYEKDHGMDPITSLNRAIQALLQGQAINPNQVYTYRYGGYAYRDMGEYQIHVQVDPQESFRKAIEWLQTGLKLNPEDSFQYAFLASVYLHQAERKLEQRQDPGAELELGRKAAAKATAIDSTSPIAQEIAGAADLLEARWKVANVLNPIELLQKAEATFQKAYHLNQEDAGIALRLAECSLVRAEYALARKQDARAEIQNGLKWIDTSLRSNPKMARAFGDRGQFLLLQKQVEAAQEAFGKAIVINKNLQRYYIPPYRWPTF